MQCWTPTRPSARSTCGLYLLAGCSYRSISQCARYSTVRIVGWGCVHRDALQENFFGLSVNNGVGIALAAYVICQALVLMMQDRWHPRFFVPPQVIHSLRCVLVYHVVASDSFFPSATTTTSRTNKCHNPSRFRFGSPQALNRSRAEQRRCLFSPM